MDEASFPITSIAPLFANRSNGPMRYLRYSIPKEVAKIAWEEYDRIYHNGQSLDRIAQRGGFGETEMDNLYPEWRNHLRKLLPEFVIPGAGEKKNHADER